jgi:sarcosine oxidase subunit alpha
LQPNRLPDGGRIDRTRPLEFRFDGRKLGGYAGDTLASALLANDVLLVGRSFKLHRPRGLVGSGPEEPNAIVEVGEGARLLPNMPATRVYLHDGLVARSTRGWPSLRFDAGAINQLFGRALSAGFYYKTFMAPRTGWRFYERLIRRSAGFGHAPREVDPDAYEHRNAHCDVLVVGGGPAGLAAAHSAAASGARVLLADDGAAFGGSLLAGNETLDGAPASDWVDGTVARLAGYDEVTLLPRSSVFGYYDHNFLTIAERVGAPQDEGDVCERLWRVRAKQVVLAQGAFERALAFCNNDRPGVMLASAVADYVNRYAVLPGRRAVVFTNNDAAYQAALDLKRAGAEVAAIVDSRAGGAGAAGRRAAAAGIPVLSGHVVTDVDGRRRVRAVRVARWNGDAKASVDSAIRIDCDLVAMSGGYSPAVHLHSQAGGRNAWDDERLCFVPAESMQGNVSAGAGNGRFSLGDCLADGQRAAATVLQRLGLEQAAVPLPAVADEDVAPAEALWRVPAAAAPERCPKQFVDFQNDTTVADLRLAVREGYRNVEHVKRYTALGFGTDQGKLGNINGMAIVAEALDKPLPEVGTTTFRPAYTPVMFGTGAGESVGPLYDPVRRTAIHEWHEAAGAPMENVGQWHRPWYFPRRGEDLDAAVSRECRAVRNGVGIMDASTLGKIDARGPDVVEFLERVYTHDVGKLEVGRCAYGILLGEDGMVMDDGVMARLAEDRYYLTTTTGGAADVLAWLEKWLQTEWPELEVYLTSLTDHYSTFAVAGPRSRELLQTLGCDTDLDAAHFPFMSTRPALLDGTPVQLARISFSGELAFEVNVDSGLALGLWERIMHTGRDFDVTPYGTETMHVLRAEKGYIIVGQDTDGSVTPVDLGMNWLLSKNKDYLGKRSLARSDCLREDRKQLVGLLPVDGQTFLPEGSQLVEEPGGKAPVAMLGHVTSSYRSACLGHPIALALVAGGRARTGETIFAALAGGDPVAARITSPVFYDPQGERQRV